MEEADSGPASLRQASGRLLPYRILKAASVAVVSLLCTLALVVSKGTTLFLVTQLNATTTNSSNCPTSCDKFTQLVEREEPMAGWLWCLLLALVFPDMLTMVKSGFLAATQHTERPPLLHVLVPLVAQTLHCLGTTILFFLALPSLSTPRMALALWSVCLIPSLFKACSDRRAGRHLISWTAKALDLVSLAIQVTSLVMWGLERAGEHPWALPLGLLLTSCGWWEAYLPYRSALILPRLFSFLRDVSSYKLFRGFNQLLF